MNPTTIMISTPSSDYCVLTHHPGQLWQTLWQTPTTSHALLWTNNGTSPLHPPHTTPTTIMSDGHSIPTLNLGPIDLTIDTGHAHRPCPYLAPTCHHITPTALAPHFSCLLWPPPPQHAAATTYHEIATPQLITHQSQT